MADHLPLVQILRKPPDGPAVLPEAKTTRSDWTAVVERLRSYSTARGPAASDTRCEFCGVDIDPEQHGHLADLPRRAILCVCRPCYLLFTHDGAGGQRFRAVPTRFELLPQFEEAGETWQLLDVPIGLAFFFRNSTTNLVTAFYPSPAGATESTLTLDAWAALEQAVPALASLTPDVEALLVRRSADSMVALIVPIDVCYELVGLIRVVWRGLQGGDEVPRRIDEFFTRAVERARTGDV
ncbi:MAG TPA: DUF5947 family protein [Vicinamibacterales bacterium]